MRVLLMKCLFSFPFLTYFTFSTFICSFLALPGFHCDCRNLHLPVILVGCGIVRRVGLRPTRNKLCKSGTGGGIRFRIRRFLDTPTNERVRRSHAGRGYNAEDDGLLILLSEFPPSLHRLLILLSRIVRIVRVSSRRRRSCWCRSSRKRSTSSGCWRGGLVEEGVVEETSQPRTSLCVSRRTRGFFRCLRGFFGRCEP